MKEIQLTQGRKVLVDDDDFEWLNQWSWLYASVGYASRYEREKNNRKYSIIYMHRIIMNCPKDKSVDHINGNTLDNRTENLRICTHAENKLNNKKYKNNKSGCPGVCWHKAAKKWSVEITVYKVKKYLGLFERLEDAVQVYEDAARECFGEFYRSSS